jgi:hypothetical protein
MAMEPLEKTSVPHIHISKRFRRWPNPAPQQSVATTISCSLRASAALREDLGLGVDGAFAPESWVARRAAPTLGLSIRASFASFAGRFETAEDCRCYNSSSSWLVASCEVWSGPTSAKLAAGAFFQSGVGDAKKFHQFSDFCSSTRSMTSLRRRKGGVQGGSK